MSLPVGSVIGGAVPVVSRYPAGAVMPCSFATPHREVVSLGYEGLTLSDLIRKVTDGGVELVVDVRLNAISRKRGLSKNGLASALNDAGVSYLHLRGLGNPKDNRAQFVAGDPSARERFTRLLREGDGRRDMDVLRHVSAGRRVGLLCFEREPATCHRSLIEHELVG